MDRTRKLAQKIISKMRAFGMANAVTEVIS
jgi:hypothetical protein